MEKIIEYKKVELLRKEHVVLKNVDFALGEGSLHI